MNVLRKTYFIMRSLLKLLLVLCSIFMLLPTEDANASCATNTTRTWLGVNKQWNKTAHWSGADVPNTSTENAQVVAGNKDADVDGNFTIGCVEILSGKLKPKNGFTLDVKGDSFINYVWDGFKGKSGDGFVLSFSGTAAQTFSSSDPVSHVRVSNDTSLTFSNSMTIFDELELTGTTSTIYIDADLNIGSNGAPVTLVIPSGVTVEIRNGSTLTALQGVTINGTLRLQPGAKLVLGNGNTLRVNSGGFLYLSGSSGNVVSINSEGSGNSYNFFMDGFLSATYFKISRSSSVGMHVNSTGSTGTIQVMDNGEFHNVASAGYALTIGSQASIPTTMSTIGFFDDDAFNNNNNIDASAYNSTATTINNWSGDLGDAANELDGNGKINWGSQAGIELVITNNTPSGFPTQPEVTNGDTDEVFLTMGFALNQATASTTDITAITATMIGTASAGDLTNTRLYYDDGGTNCVWDGGDTQAGTGSTSGAPPTITYTGLTGVTIADTTPICLHIVSDISSTAVDGKTIQFSISNTSDVTNSQGYSFSTVSGPPLDGAFTNIKGNKDDKWEGVNDSSWLDTGGKNWSKKNAPSGADTCSIGAAQNECLLDVATGTCNALTMVTGGTTNFNSTTNTISILGNLQIDAGHTISNATTGVLSMDGSLAQSISIAATGGFPGDLVINNSGGAPVTVDTDSEIGGDITVTNGSLKVVSGITFTSQGNITVQTGATLVIDAGATLEMADGKTITVNSGGTLNMIGISGSAATITSTTGGSSYNVVINGSILAEYYVFDHLGVNGVSIEAGATINSTYHLQNGSFTYPVANSSTLLFLKQQVPTNTLNGMTFSLGGSSATGTTNINSTGASAGTLTLNSYTGDLAGTSYDNDPTYLLSWLGAVNTIDITQENTSPASVDAGSTYKMGRFGFKQSLAGASYVNTDITSLKLTLTGTGSSNDISQVRIFYDSNCDSSAGTLIGTGTYSGNPATVSFSPTAGQATIEADTSSTPLRCIYVEYDIALAGIDANTVGVKLNASADFANSQSYAISSATPAPVSLGTSATITGASLTSWIGTTDADWYTNSNWTANVPDETVSCSINSSGNNPTINGGTAKCKNVTIGNGVVTMTTSSSAVWEVYGSYENTGTLTQNSNTLTIRDDGVTATNQSLNSSTTIDALTVNKPQGGNINLTGSTTTLASLSFTGSFEFVVPNAKTLVLPNGFTHAAGIMHVQNGGIIKLGNATTYTVNSGGTLKLVGASGDDAQMTSNSGTNSYNVVINSGGEIQAQYYNFDHLGVNGVSIEAGATINTTYSLQNGSFSYPVSNSSTLLKLKTQIPSSSLANMNFDLGGSGATGTKNIDTTGSAAGTLTINPYSGDLGGPSFDTDPSYVISWAGATNTIDLTQEATSPAGVNASTTYNMGRFGFQQTLAGASFSDANLSSLTITLTGTGDSGDVSGARIYYDSACSGTGGTQIGTGTFSGSPATITYSITAGDAPIEADVTTPPKRCIYVEYDVASGAIDSQTVGVEIVSASHLANDQGYALASGTPVPVNLGTASTISGATLTNWIGSVSGDWTVAGNWDAGVPTNSVNCVITTDGTSPTIPTATTASCKKVTINSSAVLAFTDVTSILEVNGDFENSGAITVNSGILRIVDGGAGTNHTLTSSSAIESLTFTKTSGGTVSVASSVLQINNLTFPAGSSFEFNTPSAKTLILPNGATIEGVTFSISAGAIVKLSDAQTLTVNATGTLKMVGSSGSKAQMTSDSGANAYNVVVNGTIQAQYYSFDHLNVNGVSIESGATINATNYLQNGDYTYPVNNSSTLLKLKTQIPGNALSNMTFDLNGAGTTSITNIDTTGSAAGTLSVSTYIGDVSGPTYDTDPTYTISWTGASNTVKITANANSPASVNAGSTYNMGRFGFEQALPGVSYVDADITSLKLSLTGTATATDIDAVRIYYDSDCNGLSGTLIGSGAFSGSPLNKTFTLSAADATVQADPATPPTRCIYIEYDIAAGATNNATAGAKITGATDMVNDQSYLIDSTTPAPIQLGTPASIVGSTTTTWTGTTDTDWFTGTNWSSGVPDSSKSCSISNVTNDPVVNGGSGTATCNNVTITNGILTLTNATSAQLEIMGNFSNSGTITQNDGVLRYIDGGSGSAQTLSSSSTISELTFNKTTGGSVRLNSTSLTIDTLTIPAGSNFEFLVPSSGTLILTNGLTLPAGTITIESGANLNIPSGQAINITGGIFKTTGTNDVRFQSLTNKATITNNGSGRYAFSVSDGSVDLTGFLINYLDDNGLNISSNGSIDNLDGGQFSYLSTNYGSVKAIQIDTTGSIPTTATNIGWNFGAPNTTPASDNTNSYYLVYAPACGGTTLSFSDWFGDFVVTAGDVDTELKIYDTDDSGPTCQIAIAASASPVSLTDLTATPYDSVVSIDWQTGSELDHAGFNVFRSTKPASGFIQVNSILIRNFTTSTTYRGIYRYLDADVVNDTSYYYKVQDVAYNGFTEMHGPVYATPNDGLGAPPSDLADSNTGNSGAGAGAGNDPTQGSVTNSGLIDLGNGVHILAQTQNSIRLEIIPPAETWTPLAADTSYDTLAVPGYANMTEVNKPELVERTILIEVDENNSTVQVSNVNFTDSAASPITHKVAPAPNWTANGSGVLVASYNFSDASYSGSIYSPSSYHIVDTDLHAIAGKKYIKIKITPFTFNPSINKVIRLTKLVLDLGLDGNPAWATSPPPAGGIAPSMAEGALRIKIATTGIYQLTYDEMASAYVDGPFKDADFTAFRMYANQIEIPLDIKSMDGLFNSGDVIRFYAENIKTLESEDSEYVLTQFSADGSVDPPLRMDSVDANPASYTESYEEGTSSTEEVEQDNFIVFDRPMGDFVDHLYWAQIYAIKGGDTSFPGPAEASKTINVNLPNLISDTTIPISINVHLKAKIGGAVNATHHVGIYANNSPILLAEKSFDHLNPTILNFLVSANYFFAGTNTLTIRVLGDMVPQNEYDIVFINKVRVDYRSERIARSGVAQIYTGLKDYHVTATVFSDPNIEIFDVSTGSKRVSLITGANITSPDGNVTYDATFAVLDRAQDYGDRFFVIEPTAYLQAKAIQLATGANSLLKDSALGADLILIGTDELLYAAADLVAMRELEGLRVLTAPIDQIYAEFSGGRTSAQAIKDFLNFANTNYVAPAPKYLLLLGDGSYDPLNKLGNGTNKNDLPVPFEKGLFLDFGSDNWFVTTEANSLPFMSVGRIPSSSSVVIRDYVAKLSAYESGVRAPLAEKSKQMTFISDSESLNETFRRDTDKLSSSLTTQNTSFSTSHINRADAGSDANTKASIVAAFDSAPLFISYIGHGAEDLWADSAVFAADDASGLTNTNLPIVMSYNCLNSNYYDPDVDSIGAKLILNPNGGAIAFWGSSSMTVPPVQMSLANNFINELSTETKQAFHPVKVGDLMLKSKMTLGSTPSTNDTLKSWTLFGDPSMNLPNSAFMAALPAPTPTSESPAPNLAAPAPVADDGGGGGCQLFAAGSQEATASLSQRVIMELLFLLFPLMLSFLLRFTFSSKPEEANPKS